MERLTEILNNLKKGISQMGDKEEIKVNKNFLKYVREYLEQLKFYKNAEEQGLILRLPCKVGDTVYFVDFDENEYDEAIVESIEFGRNGFLINSDCEIGTYLGAEYLFLTKEEAEQALKQMGE